MRKTRVVGLLAAIGAAAAMAVMPATSAADGYILTKIRVSHDQPFLQGVLSSTNNSCERGRYVYVRKQRPGPNKFVGDDVSSFTGGWSVDVNGLGTYVIKIDPVGACSGFKKKVTIVG